MRKIFCFVVLCALLPLSAFAAPPATLLDIAGVHVPPARLSDSVVVVVDAQLEYVSGALPLENVDSALNETAQLLARARRTGTPVVHVVHRGGGPLFNPEGPYFAIAPAVAPHEGEPIIEKHLPNAFAGTELQRVIGATGRKHLIIVGFMTHMCVSSTARAALDHGYSTTIVAAATATRALPDGTGGSVPAAEVQRASLAALADRFAVIAANAAAIRP